MVEEKLPAGDGPLDPDFPKAGPEVFGIELLDAVGSERESHVPVEPRIGRAIEVDVTGGVGGAGRQGDCDGLLNGVVADGQLVLKHLRRLEAIDLALIADFLLVIIGGNEVHVLAQGAKNPKRHRRDEDDEMGDDGDGPGIAR